ncbi:ABC transporter permease [Marinoscillum furvescens]|uniref:ABC-2 type transport system permease protein n=1 Tax=Marinoscillum furvescens DSM 4134 TaxID=1122208 RepID=A0A3D9L6R8_MARFU|nr:DUF3526 domain-containing protein [Marinoscillum furvescens]REE02049.1 ABC-2 type transport system permease protein [Marinoscillum furvescens DSM 4134]
MSVIGTIARKEVLVALRERRVLVLGAIVWVLLAVAGVTGYLVYAQQHSAIVQTQQEKRQEWLEQGDKHPHIAAHYGTYVFKPKTLLSLFDFGLDAYTGTSVYLEAHYQHEFMFRPAQDHSSLIRFGELSLALVLQVLVPLLIIFMSFHTITQERETGTLRLLISQGVTFQQITWGKLLAHGFLLLSILLPVVVGLIIMAFLSDAQAKMTDLGLRSILLIVSYTIYLFFFLMLSIWVSLRSSSGRNALLVLLSCWIILTVLMPKTVANVSERIYEIPSMREFRAAIAEDKAHGLHGKSTKSERQEKLKQRYLEEYQVDDVQQLPFNFEGISMQAGEDFGNRIYDHHQERLRQLFYRQNHLASIASLLNPFLAIRHLSMAMAGTDLHTFIHFENEVEHYRRELVRRMNHDMAQNSTYGKFFEYKAGRDLWDEIEDFTYQTPGVWQVVQYYKLELISLLAWVIVLCVLVYYSNRKMKPINE